MPRPGLSHRKRNHDTRILSALPQRPRQRLQPEIESRSRHESRRTRRPSGFVESSEAKPQTKESANTISADGERITHLEEEIASLRKEVSDFHKEVSDLKQQFAQFKKQFE